MVPNDALFQWDEKLHAAAQQQGGDLTQAQRTFWTAILVCNSLIVEQDSETGAFSYQVLPSLFILIIREFRYCQPSGAVYSVQLN